MRKAKPKKRLILPDPVFNDHGRSFNGNRGPRNDNRRGGGYRGNSNAIYT